MIFTHRTKINAKEKLPRKERMVELQGEIKPEISAFLANYEKLYCKNHKVIYYTVFLRAHVRNNFKNEFRIRRKYETN